MDTAPVDPPVIYMIGSPDGMANDRVFDGWTMVFLMGNPV
jgi:hypothetical protein